MSRAETIQAKAIIFAGISMLLARVACAFAAAPRTSSLYTVEVCTVKNTTIVQRDGFISVPGSANGPISASQHCVMRQVLLHEIFFPDSAT